MNLAELSIKRPIFITCLVVLMIVMGILSLRNMPVDQFPDVTFPVVFAEIIYPGASPVDVERQVSKMAHNLFLFSRVNSKSDSNAFGMGRITL